MPFQQRGALILLWFALAVNTSSAFSVGPCQMTNVQSRHSRQHTPSLIQMNADDKDEADSVVTDESIWNPGLRRIMASVSFLGVAETAIITYEKNAGNVADLCGVNGDCGSVLSGPYATIPVLDIPLSAVGCAAYATVAVLALAPILSKDENDTFNRIVLLAVTTAMATFSTFLMSLLWGVLHTSCPYCLASASFSWTLASCAWLGGLLPPSQSTKGVQSALASMAATTLASVAFFVSVDSNEMPMSPTYAGTNPTLLASTSSSTTPKEGLAPPPIQTSSSERAMALSQNLAMLNAKMYGAYWCSHCYDQKSILGKEGFGKIDYVECAKDGLNSRTAACKAKDVPGYPTWEIGGKLFPGEMELDELEDIVKDVMKK